MSSKIHPTAIIEDGASIGENCIIGPYVVIEKGATLGNENLCEPGVLIRSSASIGDRNKFLHGASIGGGPQDIGYTENGARLVVGNDNHIGEHATLHRGSSTKLTKIGNHNYLMGNIHVGHDCMLGDHIIMANDSKLGGFVHIADRVILSAGAGVHQHARVGEMVIAGALIRVTQDVLPYAMAASNEGLNGLNRIGLKRAGCPNDSVNLLKEAYRRFCKNREKLSEFISWLDSHSADPYLKKWHDFVSAQSHRGFSRHGAD